MVVSLREVPSDGAVNGGVSPPLTVEAGNGTSQDYADVARFLGTLHGGDDWQVQRVHTGPSGLSSRYSGAAGVAAPGRSCCAGWQEARHWAAGLHASGGKRWRSGRQSRCSGSRSAHEAGAVVVGGPCTGKCIICRASCASRGGHPTVLADTSWRSCGWK